MPIFNCQFIITGEFYRLFGKQESKNMKTKLVPALLALVLALFLTSAFGQETDGIKATENTKKKENFHLYLLIGGSNMTVKNNFSGTDRIYGSRIFLFNDDNEWVSSEDHVKASSDKLEETGTGPSIFFAESMCTGKRNKNILIGIINCAEDDSELADWMKGGKHYSRAVEKAKLAMNSGVLKGILWHQANSEMRKADPSKYADDVEKLARDLRKDLNSPDYLPIPFVGGKLMSHPYFGQVDEFKKLNETLQEEFNDTDRSGLVESKGLKDSGDGVHFAAESMPEFGKRYADAMLYLEGRKAPVEKKKTEGKRK